MSQFVGVHSDKMTGYKITTVDRARKFGIAANSLEMLRERALKKLKVCNLTFPFWDRFLFKDKTEDASIFKRYFFALQLAEGHIYLSDDGTKVDDEEYFASIKSQTLFVVAQEGETFVRGKHESN